MASSTPTGPYRIEEDQKFLDDWAKGEDEGWIGPDDSFRLDFIKANLSFNPLSRLKQEGLPENVRFCTFPRSATHNRGRIMLRYSVIEDDRKVVLECLFPIP